MLRQFAVGRDASTANEFASRSRSPLSMTTFLSTHFERDQITCASSARSVIRGNRAIAPFAGKIVGADEQQRSVVRGAEFQRAFLGVDSQNGSGGIRAVDGNEAASHKSCSPPIAGTSWRRCIFGSLALGGLFFEHIEGRFLGLELRLVRRG